MAKLERYAKTESGRNGPELRVACLSILNDQK